MTLSEWNALPRDRAAESLGVCCGVRRWIDRVVEGRPYRSFLHLSIAADDAWDALGPEDWREAFAHHPRIGERVGAASVREQAGHFSSSEQAGVDAASPATRAALVEVNRDYERRFGHIFLTCAAGKSAEDMLAEARSRLANDPGRELAVAAEEQRKIMQVRLRQYYAAHQEARA